MAELRRLLVTGLNGTLAPHLAAAARAAGIDVVAWDRSRLDPEDPASLAQLDAGIDGIAHLAMGSAAWAARLAAWAAERGLPYLFTSTVMVFDHAPDGPHGVADARTARDDYGRYKIECEDAVRAASAGAGIVRIGWQIDAVRPGNNNMLKTLDEWQRERGVIGASRLWRPACSFMDDTAAALLALLREGFVGTTHLDSNAEPGWSFDAIVRGLQQRYERDEWRIEANDDYRHDQRLVGGRPMPALSERLDAGA